LVFFLQNGQIDAGAFCEEKVSPSLFDVSTQQVFRRIINSIVPTEEFFFHYSEIKKKPDLYGKSDEDSLVSLTEPSFSFFSLLQSTFKTFKFNSYHVFNSSVKIR
jgi:hypothetical protein